MRRKLVSISILLMCRSIVLFQPFTNGLNFAHVTHYLRFISIVTFFFCFKIMPKGLIYNLLPGASKFSRPTQSITAVFFFLHNFHLFMKSYFLLYSHSSLSVSPLDGERRCDLICLALSKHIWDAFKVSIMHGSFIASLVAEVKSCTRLNIYIFCFIIKI